MPHNNMLFDPTCIFCRELAGSRDTNFARLYPEIDTRIFLHTDHLILMPCIGQLTPTHCLVVPKSHFRTVRDASAHSLSEIRFLVDEFENELVPCGERMVLFEHGALTPADGGCGIYHAHLHLLSLPMNVCLEDLYPFQDAAQDQSLEEALTAIHPERCYAIFGVAGKGVRFAYLDQPMVSQYFRQRVAAFLRLSEWDWRKFSRQPSLLRLLANRSISEPVGFA